MNTKKAADSTTTTEIQHFTAMKENAARLQKQIDDLEAKIKLARGTADVTREAAAASAGNPTLAARAEAILRRRPMSIEDLAQALATSVGRVSAAVKPMRRRLHNVGSAERPKWSYIVGDEATPQDLYALVEGLMRERPHTHAELIEATGARENRVAGAINEMRRTKAVVNVGDGKARWFIVPEGTKLAKLTR